MIIRHWFYIVSGVLLSLVAIVSFFWPKALWGMLVLGPLFLLGMYDTLQREHNILRNYPVWGHWRYLLLSIRPMIQSYFIETSQEGRPFSHEERFMVYSRSEHTIETMPFGTRRNLQAVGAVWMVHSLAPKSVKSTTTRTKIGGDQCRQPYFASRLNISAMSYGALSSNAVRALNRGAQLGNFYQNTGEGGLSPHHLREGGDVVWQIGTALFGCRTEDGRFDPDQFVAKSKHPHVKMIEVKMSQGAKPSHGGILPAAKITQEIAEIRGIKMGQDCVSPPVNPECRTPIQLLQFIDTLRELSGGKPVGFKLCVGLGREFMSICKAMLKTGIYPDFITVDGAEGGTGAAPVEFSNNLGMPLNDGLMFVHNCLVGIDLRDKIKVIASGKIISGFDIAVKLALGADLCNSARGMMFSIGCLQSLRCNDNTCPTGVATQDPSRAYALNVRDKAPNVYNFHKATINSFLEFIGAAGLESPDDLKPWHIFRRISESQALHYDEIYDFLSPGQLLKAKNLPEYYKEQWEFATADGY